jgi:glycerol kinase
MKYLLAIDQGTSSTRAVIYTSSGNIIAISQQELTQFYPQAGWVEHCPEEIWSKTLQVVQEVVSQVNATKIIACGLTNQRETTLLWDKKTGKCLYPAIVWQDRRTEVFCESLSPYSNMIKEKTGLRPDPYFSASKLRWLLNTIPDARALAQKKQLAFGTIDTFLLWRLTKGKYHLTDVTNASRTLLFNIQSLQWDQELLSLFDIPDSILPIIQASDAQYGTIEKEFTGFSIPVTGVAGDQQAALIGQQCVNAGMIKATFGTGAFMLMNTGTTAVFSNHNLLTTIAYQADSQIVYGLEGSIYHAGTTVKWLRDEMKIIATSAETETLAKGLADNAGVYLVSSFTGLGAPHWISSPGATIIGLSQQSNRAHLARAALEGVCYQTREVLDAMREDSGINNFVLRVDGGMSVNNWFLQFLSSQCNLLVQRPADVETTAKGAALLAALGCGEISSLQSADVSWESEKDLVPEKKETQRELEFQGWLRAVRMLKGE